MFGKTAVRFLAQQLAIRHGDDQHPPIRQPTEAGGLGWNLRYSLQAPPLRQCGKRYGGKSLRSRRRRHASGGLRGKDKPSSTIVSDAMTRASSCIQNSLSQESLAQVPWRCEEAGFSCGLAIAKLRIG